LNTKWLDLFKIASIEEDIKAVEKLLKEIPEFKKIEDMKSAYALINDTKKKFEKKKLETKEKMNKVQKAKKFLNQREDASKFDEVY